MENHHISGRSISPETVPLCKRCHACVTRWQRTAGIDLRKGMSRTDMQILRAKLVGYALLGELLCRLYGRIISRALDDGTWSPNPKLDRNLDRSD